MPCHCSLIEKVKDVGFDLQNDLKTDLMNQLQSFKGFIGVPVNYDNLHWGLVVADNEGVLSYCDSLHKPVTERITLIGQLVFVFTI